MNNITRALTVEYPKDIPKIRTRIPAFLHSLSDIEVEMLWRAYSRDIRASYLCVHENNLEEFAKWLRD